MSFRIPCPVCGDRENAEFSYGGPVRQRPSPGDDARQWSNYIYFRENPAGEQDELWSHRSGCKTWFVVKRDTRDNRVLEVRPYTAEVSHG